MTREVLQQEPECPECKAVVLYECVACSNNNYPPQREWVGLTDREREECEEWLGHDVSSQVFYVIEYKLKEKNK
jgi:hypothetical protein